MRVSTFLEAAKQTLVDNELGKGVFARDKNGDTVGIPSPNAVCFCTMGLLHHTMHFLPEFEYDFNLYVDAEEIIAEVIGGTTGADVYNWNDVESRTKLEVLEMFDKAIAKAKEKEGIVQL